MFWIGFVAGIVAGAGITLAAIWVFLARANDVDEMRDASRVEPFRGDGTQEKSTEAGLQDNG